MIDITVKPSKNSKKKYDAIIERPNGRTKTISFGASGMSDYTIHKDPERKERYLKRHAKNENWNDYTSASFYATRILWNKPSITASIKDINNKFKNLNIKYIAK